MRTDENRRKKANPITGLEEKTAKPRSRRRRGRQRKLTGRLVMVAFFTGAFALLIYFGIQIGAEAGHILKEETAVRASFSKSGGEESGQHMETPEEALSQWNLQLVNKGNPVPEKSGTELVEVPGGEKVDKRIYEPLMEMLEAGKEANLNRLPKVVSGFRTQEKQQELYEEKIREYENQGCSAEEAVRQAEQWVAMPGHSEHELGLAVDINGEIYDIYLWLQENSYKYGFIFRYPGDKSEIIGTAEEVWHYRYVGAEAAAEMYEEGLCLEEYLERRQGIRE